jgi:Asp-tRNA(Asn)/Glu-tRNA(Gln) amidotransferase A subunit family amidase
VGYKPSFGYIARAGVKSLSESLDTIGGLARSVEDVALLVAALSNRHRLLDLDWRGRARIGVFRGPSWHLADHDGQAALELAATQLSRAGAAVSDAILPESCDKLVELQQDIMAFEAFHALSHERLSFPEQISPALHELFDRGAAIDFDQYWACLAAAADARQASQAALADYDVLLTPGARGEAPKADTGTGDPVFCRSWTLLGLPCVQLPVMAGATGLPVGVQLVGAYGNDHAVLQVARWAEEQLQRQG